MSFETWRTRLHPGERLPTLVSTDIWCRETLLPPGAERIRSSLKALYWNAEHAASLIRSLAGTRQGRVQHEISISEAMSLRNRQADANSYAWKVVGDIGELGHCGLLSRLDAFFAPLPDEQLADYHNAKTEVRWDEADKIYVARSLEFPSMAAHGSSIWEAERQLRDTCRLEDRIERLERERGDRR